MESKDFFDLSSEAVDPRCAGFRSFTGRFAAFKRLICLVAALPLNLLKKAYKTLCRLFGLVWSFNLVLITLGLSEWARDFFFRRAVALARDLADWILLPFAVVFCLVRLLLASLVHPVFYFGH